MPVRFRPRAPLSNSGNFWVFDSIHNFTSETDIIRIDAVGDVDFNANASASVTSVNLDNVTDFQTLEVSIEAALSSELASSTSNSAQVYDVKISGSGLAASGIDHLIIVTDSDSTLSSSDLMLDLSAHSSPNVLSADFDFIA